MKTIYTFISLIALSLSLQAQSTLITGKISDFDTGKPLSGVLISQSFNRQVALSDSLGQFQFSFGKVPGNDLLFQFRLLGYQLQFIAWKGESSMDVKLKRGLQNISEVTIAATRASESAAFAFSTLERKDIQKINSVQDIPLLLDQTPSVVTFSDAGNGVGYTGLRIRGSDITRINVTINGIPVNDAESHGVFWVNMPDLASSIQSLQVQRGVGTSTNGAAAFGASMNINTQAFFDESFASFTGALASFNTQRASLRLGHVLKTEEATWNFEGRLSTVQSDGFIERASSDLKSFFTSAARYGKKSVLRLNVFSGKETTYQAWYGVPKDSLQVRPTYNPAGAYFVDGQERYYDNETDNYQQDHYQLLYTYNLGKWALHAAGHYTRGRGYYEQFIQNDVLSLYGASPVSVMINDSLQSIDQSDVVRRLWLDNHFYGGIFSATRESAKHTLIVGGGANQYIGDHFGQVIHATWAPELPHKARFYENRGIKSEANFYTKGMLKLPFDAEVYADVQWRAIRYQFDGIDNNLNPLTQSKDFLFFNPKLGLSKNLGSRHQFYASVARASREPIRDDFVNSRPNERPKHETLTDFEGGWRMKDKRWTAQANAFYMAYRNQLVFTGAINDVGAFLRSNVDRSYRAGLELETQYFINKKWRLALQATLSENKINSITEFVSQSDAPEQVAFTYTNTYISFSPALIAGSTLSYNPTERLELALQAKYVSRQYLDNSSARERSLDPFAVADLRIQYALIKNQNQERLSLGLKLNNVSNTLYTPNGYTFSDISGGQRSDFIYLYPMALRNYALVLSANW